MISNAITGVRLLLLVPLYLLASAQTPGLRWWALGVFLVAGLTDVIDGRVARRLGEVSKAGALLDLVADRLLTLAAVAALAASGTLTGVWLVCGVVLVGRDVVVAALNEALPGRLDIRVSWLERVKIALQFIGLGLLIAPAFPPDSTPCSRSLGLAALAASALLACATVLDYSRRAAQALRES